jgi:two-component system response regulator DevR
MGPIDEHSGLEVLPRDDCPAVATTRVFLLDDHEIVRRGLRELLDAEPDIEICGEAATAAEARERIPSARVDVAVLDVRLPDGNGVEVCREIRASNPEVRCLMLTSYAEDEAVFDAVLAGAQGYVLKQVRGGSLLDAIRRVAVGESLLEPSLVGRLLDRLRTAAMQDDRFAHLGQDERSVLELLADGRSNAEIGACLDLDRAAVAEHVGGLLAMLGMQRHVASAATADHRAPA